VGLNETIEMSASIDKETVVSVGNRLYQRYGELMRLDELSEVLRYPTPDALRKAIARGHICFATIKIENRRGIFIKTATVVEYLQSL
jgi:hypothetical protein